MDIAMIKIWELVGIPIIFILGSALHFVYHRGGENPLLGIIAPVNESVWEHEKLLFIPFAFYLILESMIIGGNSDNFFMAKAVAIIIAMVFMIVAYYGYKLVVTRHSTLCNVLLLLVSVMVAQHFSFYFQENSWFVGQEGLGKIILGGIWLLLILWTFFPPHLPLFKQRSTGTYGIKKSRS